MSKTYSARKGGRRKSEAENKDKVIVNPSTSAGNRHVGYLFDRVATYCI